MQGKDRALAGGISGEAAGSRGFVAGNVRGSYTHRETQEGFQGSTRAGKTGGEHSYLEYLRKYTAKQTKFGIRGFVNDHNKTFFFLNFNFCLNFSKCFQNFQKK